MSHEIRPNVLSILQPDLLTVEELVQIMESRCCKAENLRLMAKEGLVELFRRVVLPLPQRLYRTNRRGKMLTARRARAGPGSDRKEEGSLPGSSGRLKPPPDIHNLQGLRVNCGNKGGTNGAQSGGMKDRRGLCSAKAIANDRGSGAATSRCKPPSERRITLKRPSSDAEKLSDEAPAPINGKRQRTVIKWP